MNLARSSFMEIINLRVSMWVGALKHSFFNISHFQIDNRANRFSIFLLLIIW